MRTFSRPTTLIRAIRANTRFSLCAAFVALGLFVPNAGFAQTQNSTEIFSLDTLTIESARAADSSRLAAAEQSSAAAQTASGEDTAQSASAALEGTREGRGSISGRVVSEARGTVVAGVRVIVAGQNLSTETDADGKFGFPDVGPGSYSLFLYHSSYAPLTLDGVEVTPGRDVARRLPLPDKALQGEAVRITGTAGKASEAGMLFAQKNAPSVSDGISSEQISKSPDGDAAAALKRVTGISIGGDGLVYVRGLGERYVNMQLNGMTVSSPNPEKRIVPLDLFPTRLLENLTVSKTFSAEQPAEFAGGSLQLRTKDYPDKRVIEFSTSASYEPGTTFGRHLTYEGGKYDFLGIDDGTRAIPGNAPKEYFDESSPNMGATPEEQQARQRAILAALPNVWTPYTTRTPLNQGYGLTLGNKIPLGGDQIFGWLVGGSYSSKFSVTDEYVGRIRMEGGRAVYRDESVNEISTEAVQWGLLGTSTYQPGPAHKFRINVLANRDWEDEVTRVFGKQDSDNDTSLIYELANAQQDLLNGQLEGEHLVREDGTKLTWVAALTRATRTEPDRRVSRYIVMHPEDVSYNPDFPFFVGATSGLQDRFWFDLAESGYGGKADLEIPVTWYGIEEGSKIKTGTSFFSKGREYDVRRLSYFPGGALTGSTLGIGHTYEDFFGVLNGLPDTGYVSNKNEKEKDNYTVEDKQWAVHAQGDWVITESWRAIAGVRLMNATVEGRSTSDIGALASDERAAATCSGSRCIFKFGYDKTAWLPALSLVYAMTPAQNIRAAWTRTFSFPEYREMAPLLFYSYQNAEEVVGNVDLKPTDIYNYDLRWEWFPSGSELVALSGFYKRFNDPVELRITPVGSNNRASYENVPSANLWGAESEFRIGGERAHEMLADFQLTANFTFIQSEVQGERKRSMQGQSPYLINTILFFEPFNGNTQMSLLYNKFGRRLSKVGVGIFPDVYEEARESLEYSYTQKFGKKLKTKFTAKNLTDAEIVQTQGGLATKRTRPGMNFSLGVTYAL